MADQRFLAVMTHDMSQPVHALSLYISALERRVVEPDARDILNKMKRASDSLASMLAGLADLARVQAADFEPALSNFTIHGLMEQILASDPKPNVVAALPMDPIYVRSDADLVESLLRHLIANGSRHGGGAVRVVVTPAGKRLLVSAVDEGPGIALEDQDRIFHEFVRLEGKRATDGLGLGLAIAKRISDLLDLSLTLRSAPGEGATFCFSLPISQNPNATT